MSKRRGRKPKPKDSSDMYFDTVACPHCSHGCSVCSNTGRLTIVEAITEETGDFPDEAQFWIYAEQNYPDYFQGDN